MKNIIYKTFQKSVFALSTIIFIGCENEPEPLVKKEYYNKVSNAIELKGNVTSDITLDAANTYELTSSYVVKSGGKLTIPAGTKITVTGKGTSTYIAVLMGGKIDIQGTNESPVVITSPSGQHGQWGGLTICGKASTTKGAYADAEVGGFKYGGSNDADNSGSIKYLVIKGTGASINENSQYNGVSFYAVGSGTNVENVAVINGDDDGVEFFGGSVKVKNIYLENNSDDSIDWTEGWNGSVENAYIYHTKDGFSTAFEGDGENKFPEFINITAICTAKGSKRTALQFKANSGGSISNLYLEGYTKNIEMKDKGALSNVKIEGVDAVLDKEYQKEKLDISSWTWFKK